MRLKILPSRDDSRVIEYSIKENPNFSDDIAFALVRQWDIIAHE